MSALSPPPLMLIGSGSQIRHQLLLSDLSREASVVLLQPGRVTWQKPYIYDWVDIDPSNISAVLKTAQSLARKFQIEAVVTYEENLLPIVGEITYHTDLKGLSRETIRVVRDKYAQRVQMRTHQGKDAVRSELVFDVASGEAIACELGYPVVIKPRNLSGNLGVKIVPDALQFRAMYDAVMATDPRGLGALTGVLVEEFLDGPEFSIDCWVLDGQASALFTARIFTNCAQNVIDTGSIVGPGIANQDAIITMQDAACLAAIACGANRTIVNVDVKWSGGRPRILEVNGRPGGLLPHLAFLTSGLRVGEALAEVARGCRPAAPGPIQGAAGFVFIYPKIVSRFGGLRVATAYSDQDWLVRVQETVQLGERVLPPHLEPWGHVGWGLVTGETADVVAQRLKCMEENTEVLIHSD